jgi:phosphatidylserine/phosphatidylglycerophosphate/cardiolipin synthase-like enzyme
MIANAIRKAKNFIYTEDQYFVGTPELQAALLAALPTIEHFTAVITFWSMADMPYINTHRRKFINELRKVGGDKVRIFCMRHNPKSDKEKNKIFYKGNETHTYVHSKIWIIDDEFATIGSINSNRRGWSHDCEVSAGIYERSTDQTLHYRFAHWLRIKIWQEHLGMQSPGQDAELWSGTASAVHWLRRPKSAIVQPYDLDETDADGKNDLGLPHHLSGLIPVIPATVDWIHHTEYIWNHFVDPA